MTRSANRTAARLAKSAGIAALLAVGMPAGLANAHVERIPICLYFTNDWNTIEGRCAGYTPARNVFRWQDIPHEHYTPPSREPVLPDGY